MFEYFGDEEKTGVALKKLIDRLIKDQTRRKSETIQAKVCKVFKTFLNKPTNENNENNKGRENDEDESR